MTNRLLLLLALPFGACTESHAAGECDPDARAGDGCVGDWVCPETSLDGSTGTHFTQTRCEDGTVHELTWSEPPVPPTPTPEPIRECDLEARLGAPCEGAWECPEQTIGTSTGTRHDQTRCEEGRVVRDTWFEPIAFPDAGMPDAGAIDADAGADDAGAVLHTGTITCGVETCDAATHGCLASCQRGGAFEPACIPVGMDGRWPGEACPALEEQFPRLWLTCDGPEDCAEPEGCRLTFGSLGQYTYCSWGDQRLCHDASDCLPGAPRCVPTPHLPGYSTCVE
jgi:hypothetical protein